MSWTIPTKEEADEFSKAYLASKESYYEEQVRVCGEVGMADREKVLAALKNCLDVPQCRDCPWEECEEEHECVEMPRGLVEAVVELLKKQEPKPVIRKESELFYWFECPGCGHKIPEHYAYCCLCGQAVKWDE